MFVQYYTYKIIRYSSQVFVNILLTYYTCKMLTHFTLCKMRTILI
ncbi:hypothetical protein VPHD292_0095 [Vibrio phage D292]